jgi:hypothetical protein
VALYELVTGEVPFSRPNYNALMQAIIHDEPRAMTESGCDAKLWKIVERALEKRPEDRWQTMGDFGSALAAWLVTQDIAEDVSGNSVRAVWLREAEGMPPLCSSLPPPASEEESFGALVKESRPSTANLLQRLPRLVRQRRVGLLAALFCVSLLGWLLGSSSDPVTTGPVELAATTLAEPAAPGRSPADGSQDSTQPGPVQASQAKTPEDLPLLEAEAPRTQARSAKPRPAKKQRKAAKRDFGF